MYNALPAILVPARASWKPNIVTIRNLCPFMSDIGVFRRRSQAQWCAVSSRHKVRFLDLLYSFILSCNAVCMVYIFLICGRGKKLKSCEMTSSAQNPHEAIVAVVAFEDPCSVLPRRARGGGLRFPLHNGRFIRKRKKHGQIWTRQAIALTRVFRASLRTFAWDTLSRRCFATNPLTANHDRQLEATSMPKPNIQLTLKRKPV